MFRKTDFVSSNVQPTFNSQSKVDSILGVILSVVIAVIGGFGFLYFGIEVYEKKKPDVKFSSEMIQISQINIDETIPLLMIRKSDAVISFNPSIQRALKLYGIYNEIISDEQKKITIVKNMIPIVRC